MKKYIVLFAISLFFFIGSQAQVSVQHLLCENRENPVGIDAPAPRLSWQLISGQPDVYQSAYEIRVAGSADALKKGRGLTWSSGRIASDASVCVPYAGPKMEPAKNYYWQVRVWDGRGKATEWSPVARWQTGLLGSGWTAKWIEAGFDEDTLLRPSPLFRRTFSIAKKISGATLFITAHGLYKALINGKKAGDAFLTPGFTSYNKRLQYQAYDVTGLIQPGENVIAAVLGSGWYRGYLAWHGHKDSYGNTLALLAQLEVTYVDGSRETIVSDDHWKSATGGIQSSEIYNGETFDARKIPSGWMTAGFSDRDWSGVRVKAYPFNQIVATENELVTKHETFRPVRIFKTPQGDQVIDFGQNLVGWVNVRARGKSGDRITISHAEVLDKEGNFYTENLRAAKQQNTYILSGSGEESFEPHFTFQGFRYIKIAGYPGEIRPEDFTAVALYSDMPVTGTFTTSNPLINQLQHNIQWGQRGNFLDVPTDCPQRDERLGWTGDAQVFSRTASFNMGVDNFFSKWLKDVAADQNPDGGVPFVVPNVLNESAASSAGWADVSTIIPWNMYLAYGDRSILMNQYPSMKAWVNYMKAKSKNDLWNTGFHFGDWLFYHPDDDADGRAAITDKYLIAQCFYAHSTQLLINAAKVLGNKEDLAACTELLQRIKTAFVKEYVTPSGRLVSGTQTAYVLALQFDMLPESLRSQAADRLVENIHSYDNHLTTGFLGTPYLCEVLTRFGHTDVAYELLLQDTYPSWLYPVRMGATTIWERWDGQKPDSSFETPGMNSFNHYAYGAIGDFMYREIAGIDTYDSFPGYKKIRIKPHPGGGFSYVNAGLKTYYGLVSSNWKVNGNEFTLEVDIPCNTRAGIYLPAKDPHWVTADGLKANGTGGLQMTETEDGYQFFEVPSGHYRFTCKLNE